MQFALPGSKPFCWLLVPLCLSASPGLSTDRVLAEEAQESAADAMSVKGQPEDARSPPKMTDVERASRLDDDIDRKPADSSPAQPKPTSIAIKAKTPASDGQSQGIRPFDDAGTTSHPESSADAEQAGGARAKKGVVQEGKRLIGEIAMVLEKQSQFYFQARVDTGAHSCSIHADEVVIEDSGESMEDNVGKVARIKLKNLDGESQWVETRIKRLVRVRTSERAELRYVVPLTLAYDGLEKEVRVTLNDRSTMAYPMLLGRNFLRGDLVVDVDLSAPD